MSTHIFFKRIAVCILLTSMVTGCRKLAEVPAPVTSINSDNIFTNDNSAAAVLTGIYTNMSSAALDGAQLTGTSFLTGLSSDEFTLYSAVTSAGLPFYYANNLNSGNFGGSHFYNGIYPVIFLANTAIEKLPGASTLTPAVQKQLLGEAKFIRSLCYFYLVNLYGDVPLVLTTDYTVSAVQPRTPKAQVYSQVINDLKDAQSLLSATWLDGTLLKTTADRVRPTSWAATALLARVYLYIGDYANAEAQATTVIGSTQFSLPTLANAFLRTSAEAIWQLQPVVAGQNTPDAIRFVLPSTGPNTTTNPLYLSSTLVNSFEATDNRKNVWVGKVTPSTTTYWFANKYKVNTTGAAVTEFNIVLRLGEQYLIRAEARAQQNNVNGAQADLNTVRNRAGLLNTTAADKASLIAAILHEKQVELFSEWGHRWLDLKRSGTVDAVMTIVTAQKGGSWNTNAQLYPIPLGELKANPNMTQNQGY
ncbi:MAG: RagB/SusD family nutrient uptake outer membrane protein [Sphingobacteriia bacterium]|nr:RagB/SusD family nutrient uptake outer membrane protein [Sphingobacteriia bacterium]